MKSIVTIFGNVHRAEFREIAGFINEQSGRRTAGGNETGSFILFQSYPNEFSQNFVDELIRKDPLAPIVLVAGAGCEGEARTGRPPRGVFRFYVRQWKEYQDEFKRFLNAEYSVFSLPKTAGDDEIAVYLAQKRPRQDAWAK